MTMKLTQLRTHWNADEAETVIEFLDELKEIFLAVYSDDIKKLHQTDHIDSEAIGDCGIL